MAEETGLINAIGEWVLRQACAEAATWPNDIKVAVNVSPVQFRSQGLPQAVINALAAANLAPHRLELEITELVLMQSNETTLRRLHQLRELGVRISMDDFGTGYSSLSYLRSFPFDKIKIDRSFINDLSNGSDAVAIVQAIITLANSLKMTTTAEGVETEQQAQSAARDGLHRDAGLSVQPAETGPGNQGSTRRALRRPPSRSPPNPLGAASGSQATAQRTPLSAPRGYDAGASSANGLAHLRASLRHARRLGIPRMMASYRGRSTPRQAQRAKPIGTPHASDRIR